MGAIKGWSLLLCFAATISAMVEFLIPPGKIGKTMNLILGIFGIIVFFTPFSIKYHDLKNIFKNNDLNKISEAQKITKNSLTESLNNQIIESGNEKIKLIISKNLKNINAYPKKIEVSMDKDENNRIVMIKCKIFINSNSKNLKEQIKKEIENKLNIKTEVIEMPYRK